MTSRETIEGAKVIRAAPDEFVITIPAGTIREHDVIGVTVEPDGRISVIREHIPDELTG